MTSRLPLALAVAAALVAAPTAAAATAVTSAGTTGTAGVAAAVATAAADDTTGETGTTWALQPAGAEGPDGRVSLRHTIDGGAAVDDLVALTNFGPQPATYAVYPGDGTVSADGNFDLAPADEPATGGGAWITVGSVDGATARDGGGIVLEVPAETTVTIPVRVEVPANATPGDHPAGIVAELVPADSDAVQLASRVGVRAHLRVSGDIVASVVPDGTTATYTPSWNPFAPGTVTVTYALSNDGNVRLGAETDTAVSGPFGILAASAATESREILPGQAQSTTVEVPVWPTFFSWGTVTATPLVVGEDEVNAALAATTAEFTVWTIPWSQLALLALLVGGFFAIRALRARSAARVQARIDAAVAAAKATEGTPAPPAADADAAPAAATDTAHVAADTEPAAAPPRP